MEDRRKSKSRDDRKSNKRDGDSRGERRGGSSHRAPRFTIPKGTDISYKNLPFLQKCLTERGKILSRRLISSSAKQQRLLCVAVKRARFLGLLPSGSSRKK
jgi:small subunit ribosomal protein S18